jgi:hypothetical protein
MMQQAVKQSNAGTGFSSARSPLPVSTPLFTCALLAADLLRPFLAAFRTDVKKAPRPTCCQNMQNAPTFTPRCPLAPRLVPAPQSTTLLESKFLPHGEADSVGRPNGAIASSKRQQKGRLTGLKSHRYRHPTLWPPTPIFFSLHPYCLPSNKYEANHRSY